MLCLKRKLGESVVIGEGPSAVVVKVIQLGTWDGVPTMRLGFEGPRDVPIHRLEVYEEIHGGPPPVVKS